MDNDLDNGDLTPPHRNHGGLERWRGAVSAHIAEQDRQLVRLTNDLDRITDRLDVAGKQLAELGYSIRDARSDIGDLADATTRATATSTQEREQELTDLRVAIQATRLRKRDVALYIAAPILVAAVLMVVVYLLTGSVHGR